MTNKRWNERLHRMADGVNALWVIGIGVFLLFILWLISKYDLLIVAVLGSVCII